MKEPSIILRDILEYQNQQAFLRQTPDTVHLGKNLCHALSQKKSDELFDLVFEQQAFPEIALLFNVKERLDYHPEGTTGEHMKLVMKQAFLLSDDTVVHCAALLHDLGKAITGGTRPDPLTARYAPLEEGKHVGHDNMGISLIKQFFAKYDLPPDWLPACCATAKYHQRIHTMMNSSGKPADVKVWLRLLEDMDADATLLKRVSETALIDARGRAGFDQCQYPQADLLQQIHRRAQAFNETKPEVERIKTQKQAQREVILAELKDKNPAWEVVLLQQSASRMVEEWVDAVHPEWRAVPMKIEDACRPLLEGMDCAPRTTTEVSP